MNLGPSTLQRSSEAKADYTAVSPAGLPSRPHLLTAPAFLNAGEVLFGQCLHDLLRHAACKMRGIAAVAANLASAADSLFISCRADTPGASRFAPVQAWHAAVLG